ncbi:MAG: polysaccharide deacetylase family protein [Myxococcales bacterium]|nr:polysaccharide deacetylase family protein [Myxococcales bacterium]
MIRRIIKTAVCEAATWARLDAWLEERGPIVIGYHRVVEDPRAPDLMPGIAIGVATLARQLEYLGRRRRFASLDEVGALLARRVDAPVCAVTFDDAYRDVLTHALPVLRRLGVPAAVFVVSGAVAGGKALLHDRLFAALCWLRATRREPPPSVPASLRPLLGAVALGRRHPYEALRTLLESCENEPLEATASCVERAAGPALVARERESATVDGEALRALSEAGLTIGSHSRSHRRLVGESLPSLALEVTASRRELAAMLGRPVEHFAYPDGDFDETVVRAVADAGYAYAYTACLHRDPEEPMLTIPRRILWEQSAAGYDGAFSEAIFGLQTHCGVPWFDPCRRDHGQSGLAATARARRARLGA